MRRFIERHIRDYVRITGYIKFPCQWAHPNALIEGKEYMLRMQQHQNEIRAAFTAYGQCFARYKEQETADDYRLSNGAYCGGC